MDLTEKTISQYKDRIKGLIQLLEIEELTIIDENKIDPSLISDDKLETKLNELLYTCRRVYPNLDGDAMRLKLMGNIHYRDEDGKVKSKSYQIYRLSKKEREDIQKEYDNAREHEKESYIPWEILQRKYKWIIELCYRVEQVKLYEKIKKIEESRNALILNDDFERDELEKFFIKKTRKQRKIY